MSISSIGNNNNSDPKVLHGLGLITDLISKIRSGSTENAISLIQELKNLGCSLDEHLDSGDHIDSSETTFLHLAAGLGRLEIVLELINQGASVNPLNKNGETPLERALISEKDETAAVLLSLGGTRECLNRKILAHIWGINGKTNIKETQESTKKINSEGVIHHLIQPPFIAYTLSFFHSEEFQKMKSPLNHIEPICSAVEQIPENAIRPVVDIERDVLADKITILHTGWKGHATALGFHSKKTVIKSNAGRGHEKIEGEKKQPVNLFFNMKNTKPLKSCILKAQQKNSRTFFTQTINKNLDLDQIGVLKKTPQQGGHCSFASLKAILHAVLELECKKIYSDPKDAEKEALRIYKAWKYYTCQFAFKDYMRNSKDRSIGLVGEVSIKNRFREENNKFWGEHVFQPLSS